MRVEATVISYRSCLPLEDADISTAVEHGQLDLWMNGCEGMCGA